MKKTHLQYFVLMVSLGALPLLSGCIATSREIADLRDDIYQLQLKLTEVQRNQADTSSKMDTVSSSMKSLNFELDDTQNKMSLLSQRLDDVESNLSQRMGKLSEQLSGTALKVAPPPSEMYRLAYGDFSKGKYELAVVGFKSYLEKFPQGELADQAQFYIGECCYSQNKWAEALAEFELVEKSYPSSSLIPSARLKRALCLELAGKADESKKVMLSLIKDFPDSPESFTAKDKLNAAPANEK